MAKHCETCRLTLVDTFTDTLSEVVEKTIAITITCVKAEEPVKTYGDIQAGVEAYTDFDTINEFEPVALVRPKAYTVFLSTGQECCRHTETLPEKELETIRSTMADFMTDALFDSVADTLAEMEAETPGDTLADIKVETPLSSLGDTLPKVEAKNIRVHTARC